MGLLRFFFITIIVLWVIRLVIRLILPSMVRNQFGKQPNRNRQAEGTISVISTPKKNKKINADKLGEFVDYEEVK